MWDWLRERLREKSTLAGIVVFVVTVLGFAGVVVDAELREVITTLVAGFASLVLIVTKTEK